MAIFMAWLTKSGFLAMETNGFIFMLHHRKNWYGKLYAKTAFNV